MFEFGFQELLLIAIVSLVVIGPERMPAMVRTIALWIGRLKRSFNSIKTEIEKEVGADEIRRQLRNEDIMAKFKHTQAQVQNTISAVKKDVDTFQKNVELEAKVAAGASSTAAASPNPDSAATAIAGAAPADGTASSTAPQTDTGATAAPAAASEKAAG
jgi:sec-independent protein translocase protein TatB